ncbi:hypothetical protein GCM10009825_30380 [Arthrobacter humicola]|uniref:HNH nuclease domain-containing protein n=1 Tax=Arthrobacter humicola TaxID=409291 RepID=A0ABN2ZG43_9MICC
MGRKKTLGRCTKRDAGVRCAEEATRRDWCPAHYAKWYDRNKHWRCQWPGCREFKYDGGRSMARKGKKLFFCRLHEVEHLRPTPEIEDMNVRRLGGSIKDINGCWVWIGGVQGNYGAFVPEGANQVSWMAHRVIWDLLVGGHRPRYELDHAFCGNPACVNPSHLEPVRRSENERRKRRPKRNINWAAAENLAVRAFAERFGLSLPTRPGKTL